DELQPRTAGRAGARRGPETTIGRLVVLTPAREAHLEPRHRRLLPVVGERPHDREPWSALRARDEGIPVAAVLRIHELAQTIGAGSQIDDGRRSILDEGDDARSGLLAWLRLRPATEPRDPSRAGQVGGRNHASGRWVAPHARQGGAIRRWRWHARA